MLIICNREVILANVCKEEDVSLMSTNVEVVVLDPAAAVNGKCSRWLFSPFPHTQLNLFYGCY